MNKNDKVNLTINNYGCNAEGVALFDGQVVFVPYSLVAENIDATIIKQTSKTNLAKINQINNQSDLRANAPCPYFEKCGGCQLQHTTYQNSLKIKTEIVQNAITNIGKINYKISNTIPSENMYHYRNKIAMPINPKTRKLGMYRPSSHKIVDIEDCLLQKNMISSLIKVFNSYLSLTKNTIFDDETKTGLIKSLVARETGNTLLVTVVINGNDLNDKNLLVDLLKQNFENFGLNLNINKLKNNVILTENFVDVYGDNKAEMFENGIKYFISNQSFMQVNDEVKLKMYNAIFSEIENCYVVDAYSGAGLLSAMMAKHAKYVYGIEIVKPATELANELAKTNNIKNLKNINGDCAIELPKLIENLKAEEKTNLTVVLDPPRKGCDKKVLDAIAKVCPQKIVYMSCDPSTLARDLKILQDQLHYSIKYIQPYDMFPQTKHVETLAVLED